MFKQRMLFYKFFSSFKIMGAIKNINSRQNIKNLVDSFWAIYVGNMHANFQVSSSTCVGREWGDIRKDGRHANFWPNPYSKILNSPLASLGRDKIWENETFNLWIIPEDDFTLFFQPISRDNTCMDGCIVMCSKEPIEI